MIHELRIESLAHGGDGVATLPSGKKVFVPATAPGDRAAVELVDERATHARGRVVELLEPAPSRVEPPCPHVRGCGGCPLQHLGEDSQRSAREEAFYESLERIGGLPRAAIPDARSLLASPRSFRYRIRCRLHLREGRLGYLGRASRSLQPIESCHLLEAPLQRLALAVGSALSSLPWVLEVELCVGEDGSGAAALRLESPPKGAAARVSSRLEGIEGLRGLVLLTPGTGRSKSQVEVVGDPVVSRPAPLAPGVLLHARPDVFAQANASANELLVGAAVDGLELRQDDRVLELYAGAGNFTFALAAHAAHVTAVEEAGAAMELARRSAAEAKLTGIRFVDGDAAKVARGFAEEGRSFDALLLDPPRVGARGIAAAVARLRPRRIAYVSCEPSTLARDLAAFADEGYRVSRAIPVDMFPQTAHVEGVVHLERA